ncbi:hypothetical protein [Wenjunlia tyrosinilytica]|uniref:Uncharacterized protein n=1 Tax=Wenjunlia tyrosinilytica TaxID=1544741 RepID=A0A917ZRJ7_9ACTN|nr:hypothetical protein [Wenjunlia tyrosinilytica]GGO88564.1 hypothetical protein GCM10012280_29690 [Wenjunlia tyrosinilytica]
MTFVQVIEYDTERPADMDQLLDRWMESTEGKRTAFHEIHAKDRDRPNHYVDIVEFPSYEQAMRNNDLPETQRIAAQMEDLCTGEPRFMNLDVLRDEKL